MLLLCLFIFISCGRTDDKKIENTDIYDLGEKTSCELKPDELAKIFEKDVSKQLDCVEKSLNLFLSFVELPDPTKIGKNDLEKFINRFFPKKKKEALRYLDIVIDINHLFFRGLPDGFPIYYLDKDRKLHPSVIDAAKTLNRYGVLIKANFKKIKENNALYWDKKSEIYNAITKMAEEFKDIRSRRSENHSYANIISFIKKHHHVYADLDIDYDFLTPALFLKKFIIGGEREILTSTEIGPLLDIAPSLIESLLNASYLSELPLKSETERSEFYLKELIRFESMVQPFRPDEFFLTHKEVLTLMTKVFKNNIDLEKLEDTIKLIKVLLINKKSAYPLDYSYHNLKSIMGMLKDYLQSRFFNNITYENIYEQMQHSSKIHTLSRPEFISEANIQCRRENRRNCKASKFDIFTPNQIDILWKRFENIAQSFRYYRNVEGRQFYSERFTRTVEGFSEISSTRYVLSQLVWAYSCPTNQAYNYFHNCSIDKEQLDQFLDDFQPILQQLNIWPPNKRTFAQNTLLLSDLFQYQSDGDGKIGTNEITEYVVLAFTAMKAGEELEEAFQSHCPNVGDDGELLYPVSCYRFHFFDVFLNKLGHKTSMSKLDKYIRSHTKEDQIIFLKHVEQFARDLPSDKVPMGNRDFMLVVGALLNIEATLVRYDLDNSNAIEYNELIKAFKVYSKAIMSIADIDDLDFAKSTFFYMVKKRNLPSSWIDIVELYFYHWFGDIESVVAERINIGALMDFLRTMSDIKNNTLRTPNHLDQQNNIESLSHKEKIDNLRKSCENADPKVVKDCIKFNLNLFQQQPAIIQNGTDFLTP